MIYTVLYFILRGINFREYRAGTVSANLTFPRLLFTTTIFHVPVFHVFWDWVLKSVTAAVSQRWSYNLFQVIVTLTCESFRS